MSSVDNRIVQMQFDNAQFEKGVSTSIKTLDRLKTEISKLGGSIGGTLTYSVGVLDKLSSDTSKTVKSISNQIADVGSFAWVIMQRLYNFILDKSVEIAKGPLFFGSIKSGFSEYETQIKSIQTILANTSDSMKELGINREQSLNIVNSKLNELNEYADRTIYNFTEMTRNIGTFTAAGVKLDLAVSSIKGIANLAAVSGSTSQQASLAMYQLSQAIASGTIRLQDWNSVVNAGMGGEVFQKALKRTAKNMGVDIDAIIKKTGSFRESLSEGWLTSDVLTETLRQLSLDFENVAKAENITVDQAKKLELGHLIEKKYSPKDAQAIIDLADSATEAATKIRTFSQLTGTILEKLQSGWAQTWGHIVGDFDEATDLFTKIDEYFGDIINRSAESRIAIITDWKKLGGRNSLITAFWNIVYAINNITKSAKIAFGLDSPISGARLKYITDNFKNLTERFLTFSEGIGESNKKIKNVSFSIQLIKAAFTVALTRIKKNLSSMMPTVDQWIKIGHNLLTTLINTGYFAIKVVSALFSESKPLFDLFAADRIVKLTDSIADFSEKLKNFANNRRNMAKLREVFKSVFDTIAVFADSLSSVWNTLGDGIASVLPPFDIFGDSVIKVFESVQSIIAAFTKVIEVGAESFKEFFRAVFTEDIPGIAGTFEKIGDAVTNMVNNKNNLDRFGRIFDGIAAVFEIIRSIISGVWQGFDKLFDSSEPFIDLFLEFLAKIGDFLVSSKNAIKNSTLLRSIITKLGTALQSVGRFIARLGGAIGGIFGDIWKELKASGVLTRLGKAFESFLDAIPGAIKQLEEWGESVVDYIKNSEDIQKWLDNVKTFLFDFADNVGEFAETIWTAIKDFFSTDTSDTDGFFKKLIKRFTSFEDTGKLFKRWIVDTWDFIVAKFQEISPYLSGFLGDVYNSIKDFISSIEGFNVVNAILTALGIWGIYEVIKGIKALSSIGTSISTAADTVSKGLGGFFDSMGKTKQTVSTGKILAIAATIAAIAYAFVAIGNMSWESIGKGTVGLVAVVGSLILAMNSMNKITVNNNHYISFAIAVGIISYAFCKLGDMEWSSIFRAMVSLITIVGLLAGVMNAINGTTFSKAPILSMGIAVGIMAFAFVKLGDLTDRQLHSGALSLVIIVGLVIAAMKLINGTSVGAGSFIGLGLAISALSFAFAKLGDMTDTQIMQGIKALTTIIGLLIIAMNLTAGATSTIGSAIGLGIAVGILSLALIGLSGLTDPKILQGSKALGVIVGLITVAMASVQGSTGKISSFIGLGLAVAIISFAFAKLSDMTDSQILQGAKSLTTIVGLIIIAMNLVQGSAGKIGSFIGLAVAIGIMTIAINVLGSMNTGTLIKGGLALCGVILALCAAMRSFGKAGGAKMLGNMLGLAIFIGVFAGALLLVKDVDPIAMLAFAGAVSALFLAIAGMGAIVQHLSIAGVTKGTVALGILVAGISAVIALVAGMIGGAMTDFAREMFRTASNLEAYSDLVSGVNKKDIDKSITIFKDLAAMALDIGSKSYSGFESFSSQVPTMGAQLKQYNSLIKDIDPKKSRAALDMVEDVGEIARQMKALETDDGINLNDLSISLTTIGSAIKLYSESVKGLAVDPITGDELEYDKIDTTFIKTMFEDLAKNLPTSEIISKVSSYAEGGGNDLTSYALGLTSVGTAISSFSDSIKSVVPSDVTNTETMLSMINKINSGLPTYGSCFEFFDGKKQTLGEFSTNIVLLGDAISNFGTSIQHISLLKVWAATYAVQMLSEIESGLTQDQNKLFSFFTGQQSLSDFATKIQELGSAFGQFGKDIDSIKIDDTTKAIEPIETLAEIDKKMHEITNSGEWFGSTNSLGTLGDGMAQLGTDFNTFVSGVTGLTIPSNIEYILSIINYIQTIALRLSGENYNYLHFDFSYYMKTVGNEVRGFFNNINGIKNTDYNASMDFIEKFKDIVIALKDIPKDGWFDLSDYIKFIGDDVKAFFNTTSDIDPSDADALGNFVYNIAQSAAIAQGLTDTSLSQLQALLNSFATLTIPEFKDEGKIAALEYASGLALGLEESLVGLTESADELISACLTSVNDQYKNWYDAGRYLGLAMALGITSRTSFIQEAAINAANIAVNAIHSTWDENSPSKVAEELGMNFDYGLANGLGNYSKVVEQSATDVGKSSIDSAKLMLANLSNDIFGDLDNEPTIRPVIDMTDVTNGVDTINGMFSANRSVNAGIFAGNTFKRNAGELAFDGNKIVGALDNKAVVTAINDLTNKFDELSDAVAGIDIVLDTGTLVGQLDTKIDRNLGVLAARRGRGN